MQEISTTVESHWTKVGEGTESFLVAAFMSNVAFARLGQVIRHLQNQHCQLSLSELIESCSPFDSSPEPDMRTQNSLSVDRRFLGRLKHVDRAIAAASVERTKAKPYWKSLQATAREISVEFCASKAEDRTLSASLLEAMHHYKSDEVTTANFILKSAPLCSQDIDWTTKDGRLISKSVWAATVGMSLLSQSHEAYLRSINQAGPAPSCRIRALKLAHQVSKQIATILEDMSAFPCRCTQTLAYHLQTALIETHNYASHKQWDMYIQSPWTAGNHALEILELCHYYGVHLLKYRHYVGAVLYSYTIAIQLGGLDDVPVLESICANLAGIVFPGGKAPTSNFHGSWARHVGCRLKFRKGQSGQRGSASWCMAIPPHQARAAAGLNLPGHEVGEHSTCSVFRIKQQDYHFGTGHERAGHQKIMSRRMWYDSVEALPRYHDKDMLDSIAALASADLIPEPGKIPPIVRFNLFAVFERCVKVISRLTNKMHAEQRPGSKDYCICFCSELLTAADRLVKNRRIGRIDAWKKHEHKLVEDVKDALVTVFGGVNEKDLLWDI
jgi:hypothetical protein